MTLARRLKQRRNSEFALIRRFPGEPCFGVQLADEQAGRSGVGRGAGRIARRRFRRHQLRLPDRLLHAQGAGRVGRTAAESHPPPRRGDEAARSTRMPVTAKIRLGWNDDDRNYLQQAQAAVDGGADALFVHGRTRNARYRFAADWDAIGEIAAAVPVPVIGNGDLLFPHEIDAARARSGCAGRDGGARGADQAVDLPRSARRLLGHHRRRTRGASTAATWRSRASIGATTSTAWRACARSSRWHLDFWCRYVPRRADGTFPTMQRARARAMPRSPLEALLAATATPRRATT